MVLERLPGRKYVYMNVSMGRNKWRGYCVEVYVVFYPPLHTSSSTPYELYTPIPILTDSPRMIPVG